MRLFFSLEELRDASEDGSGEFQKLVPDLESVPRADVHTADPDQVTKRVRTLTAKIWRTRQDREGRVECRLEQFMAYVSVTKSILRLNPEDDRCLWERRSEIRAVCGRSNVEINRSRGQLEGDGQGEVDFRVFVCQRKVVHTYHGNSPVVLDTGIVENTMAGLT